MSLSLRKKYMLQSGESERLPSGYQEVECIESTGTQYIDTGINLSTIANLQNIEVETTFQQTATPSYYYAYIFGSQNSGSPSNSQYMRTSTQGELQVSGFGFVINSGLTTQKCSVKMTKSFVDATGVCVANGTSKAQQTITPDCANENVYLLWCSNGHSSQVFKGKLFEFRFKINGTLVLDLVPCYRKSDSEVGMYDLVSGTFFTNQGSGEFLAGVSILNKKQQKLYQQVEYISFDGNMNYIDTGIYPNQNTKVEMVAENGSTQWLFGERVYSGGSYSGGFGICSHYGCYGINASSFTEVGTAKHNYTMNANNVYVDGSVVKTFNTQTFTATTKLWLFVLNQNGSVVSGSQLTSADKVYLSRVWENGTTLSQDFVPVYRKSDNEIGMLDVVNNVFYTNDGAGAFTKGNDV